jgi:hypothetical protein
MKRFILALTAAALLGAAPASAQLDFSRYVALGDSTTQGFTHLGLMDCYQQNSWSALFAEQAHVPVYEMPLVSPPGIPPILELVAITPEGIPVLEPSGDVPGVPYNQDLQLYQNLGITGATVGDILLRTGNILAIDPDNIFFDITLRVPEVPDPNTGQLVPFPAVAQAIAQDPTFVTLWAGNNDVLGGVSSGSPIEGITMTPVEGELGFRSLYTQLVGALATMTSADIVLMTVIDVSEIPFATTIPPFVEVPGLGVVGLVGENGPLTPDTRLTSLASDLIAQGWGLPLPGSPPLPEDLNLATGDPGVILRPDEIATIKAQVAALNEVIRDVASQFGLEVFDAAGVIERGTTEGYTFGAITLTSDFLTGGLVGYDAIHKQQLGHAIFAMEVIDFLNAELNAGVDQLNMADILFDNPCADVTKHLGVDPTKVSFSPAARQQFLDIFMPKLPGISPEKGEETTAAD